MSQVCGARHDYVSICRNRKQRNVYWKDCWQGEPKPNEQQVDFGPLFGKENGSWVCLYIETLHSERRASGCPSEVEESGNSLITSILNKVCRFADLRTCTFCAQFWRSSTLEACVLTPGSVADQARGKVYQAAVEFLNSS